MYKSFIIFLLLCLFGAGTSYMAGEINSNLDKHPVLTAMDVDTENERSLNDLLKSPPEPSDDNHSTSSAFAPDGVNIFSVEGSCFAYLVLDNNRGVQRPLFLLFHSFLFYELLF